MELRFIDRDTRLSIYERTFSAETGRVFHGLFYDSEPRAQFLIQSEALYSDQQELEEGVFFRLEFFIGSHVYAFDAGIKDRTIKNGTELLLLEQMSAISETQKRLTPRIEISVSVAAYESLQKREALEHTAKGLTMDISGDGLGFLTDDMIPPADIGRIYYLDFTIVAGRRFLIPAKLVRTVSGLLSYGHRYNHGFLFDYTDREEDRARLITSMLDFRLNSVKL